MLRLAIKIHTGIVRRFGFKSKSQLSLFLIWDEEWLDGEVIFAYIVFDSKRYIGF